VDPPRFRTFSGPPTRSVVTLPVYLPVGVEFTLIPAGRPRWAEHCNSHNYFAKRRKKEGEKPSPPGKLAAEVTAQGYTGSSEKPTPFRGYHFRILTAQGVDATGGARSYKSISARIPLWDDRV